MYGPDVFCKLLFPDVETVCMHVSGSAPSTNRPIFVSRDNRLIQSRRSGEFLHNLGPRLCKNVAWAL